MFGESMSNRNYGNRTMHKATCADCGNECEVPFSLPKVDLFIVESVIESIEDNSIFFLSFGLHLKTCVLTYRVMI